MENVSQIASKNHSEDIERALLGCILLSTDLMAHATLKIDKNDFFQERHSFLFDQFCQIYNERGTFDVVLLTEKLRTNTDFARHNIISYVLDILDNSGDTDNFFIYIEELRKLSLLRRVEQLGYSLIEAGKKATDVSSILTNAERYIHDIFKLEDYDTIDVFAAFKIGIEQYFDDNSKRTFSGFRALDNILSLRASEVTVVAARPGIGKTAFAISCALNIACRHKNVLIFSLEMSAKQIMQRILANIGEISLSSIQTGLLTSNEQQRITETLAELNKGKLYLVDKPNLSLAEIKSSARTVSAREHIDVIFIDYIQLISLAGSFESRQSELSKIAQEIKSLARELDIPVFVLSQLSRATEQTKEHRPLLWHLKSSGAIEEHFDNIIFLYRTDSYGNEKFIDEASETHVFEESLGEEKRTEVIIAKQRNGPTGNIFLRFIPSLSKFIDYDIAQEHKIY